MDIFLGGDSGEAAFHSMMSSFGWAKFPMINRIPTLRKDIPLTMIYGSRSWIDHCPGAMIQEMRANSYVDIQVSKKCSKWKLCVRNFYTL